ncbi:peptidoglycan-binding domain-containing protein [Streptomyces tubercidicus]|uniref:peptidoglycan-binding domain-containing protein n=1 Tax=Streptomyces tubercidicus TaxID=47759 RepID=UPI003464F1E8
MTAQSCPHCFAPVRNHGRPGCLCAATEADDFDPLHVRPYVSLAEGGEDGCAGREGDAGWDAGDGGAGDVGPGRGDPLDELPGVDAAVHLADGSSSATGPAVGAGPFPVAGPPLSPRPLVAGPPTAGTSEPLTPDRPAAGPTGRLTPEPAEPLMPRMRRRPGPASGTCNTSDVPNHHPAPSPVAPRHRRALPAVLLTAGAAVAATAVLIGTDAFSGDAPPRAAKPDRGTSSPDVTLPTADATAPAPSRTTSPPPPRSPSPDATAPETNEHPHRAPANPRPPTPTRASGSVSDSPATDGPSAPPTGPIVLREGAGGPEVVELQGRLRQLAVYPGPEDGRYDADVREAVSRYQRAYGVAGDPDGVYGAPTRASLESRTQPP